MKSILKIMLLTAIIVEASGVASYAADSKVSYVEYTYSDNTLSSEIKSVTSYTEVENGTKEWKGGTNDGWYVAREKTVIEDRVKVTGTVNLILCDGVVLDALKGIEVNDGNTLNIYAGNTSKTIIGTGKLTAVGRNEDAGIGGGSGSKCGNVTIHGGSIRALGSENSAGIGGGSGGDGGTVTIYGGTVYAEVKYSVIDNAGMEGGNYESGFGACIGGGKYGKGGEVIINGGTVTTRGRLGAGIGGGYTGDGGKVTINGGRVDAEVTTTSAPLAGAGIGGGSGAINGFDNNADAGDGGIVIINGGTVNACGGGSYKSAGIGGGSGYNQFGAVRGGDGGIVIINGGMVNAEISSSGSSTYGAAIGGGYGYPSGAGCKLTINGGTVNATGNKGWVGIDGELIINGGAVNATGGQGTVGINGKVIINGGALNVAGGRGANGFSNNSSLKLGEGVRLKANSKADDSGASSTEGPVESVAEDYFKPYMWTEKQPAAVKKLYYKDGDSTKQLEASGYTTLSSAIGSATWSGNDKNGWYALTHDTVITGRITVSGNVSLILCDGAALNAAHGIEVKEGNGLTIYAGSITESIAGTGILTATSNTYAAAGIGGKSSSGGELTINGGVILATGGYYGAGIGGGEDGEGGKVVINGGTVIATDENNGAGIGGGKGGDGGEVTINGGTVTAIGGGKYDDSSGYSAAGIGGGSDCTGGKVVINGGIVVANGGDNYMNGGFGGPGIGCSSGERDGEVILKGGMVTATGGYGYDEAFGGAGICGSLTISRKDHTGITAMGGDCYKEDNSGAGIRGDVSVEAFTADDSFFMAGGSQSVDSQTFNQGKGRGLNGSLILNADVNTAGVFAGDSVDAVSWAVIGAKDGKVSSNRQYVRVAPYCQATVNNDSEGRSYFEGEIVKITADKPENGKIFVRWSADTEGVSFADEYSETTTFIMPGKAVKVAAIYKNITEITSADKEVLYSAEGVVIPVEGMFGIPEEAGEAAYSVTNGTGKGTLDAYKLTVEKCGTFTITVETEESDTNVAGKASAMLTVNKAKSIPATVSANNRTYDRTEKPLVTVDESTLAGGTMHYALGTAAEATEPYTTAIPAKTEAGTYYVWYKVVGDDCHIDTSPSCITVVIKPEGSGDDSGKQDDPGKQDDSEKPGGSENPEDKDAWRVPLLDGQSYASSKDDFGVGVAADHIGKLTLDFTNVAKSAVKSSDLTMTVIAGSKLTTVASLKDKDSASATGGVKVKINKNTLKATITCKKNGNATLTMDDGITYTITFTVEKPKAKKLTLSAGSGQEIKTIKDLFNTEIDSGTLIATPKKNASKATVSADNIIINPEGKDSIKVRYKYLNKKYKTTIKVK